MQALVGWFSYILGNKLLKCSACEVCSLAVG